MAEAARARAAPPHPGLPDEIAIWEILVRLPPKALLRCRAVCRAWRSATTTRDFLLAHHTRQPSLPLLLERADADDGGLFMDIMPLDHRAGVAAAAGDQLQSVARVATHDSCMLIEASCDGLLIVRTFAGESCFFNQSYFSVCNPATRQHAPLPLLRGFGIAGMYPHPPTGEYRLLLYPYTDDDPPLAGYECFVYALGSLELPRCIGFGWPEVEEVIHGALNHVHLRGGLHWFIEKDKRASCMVMVFDTVTELFRQMRAPAVPGRAQLFVVDGMLGMTRIYDACTTIDIWTTQDYDNEVWAFKYRVKLPVGELTERFGFEFDNYMRVVVSSWDDDDVLILVKSGKWLFQIDMGGKLVASFNHRKLLWITQLRLKQSLVSHTFFPAIDGYVVNTWPFVSPDDFAVNT